MQDSDWFRKAFEYNTYWSKAASSLRHEHVAKHAAKWRPRLQTHIKVQILNSINPILITCYLHTFKMVCDNKGIHEQAAM